MKITALVENTKPADRDDLIAEHGLSLHIECNSKRILFDTGASDAFEKNANRLGINLEDVDVLVLSHHHYDHGGGLERFLEINHSAKVYLRQCENEDLYFKIPGIVKRYIGLDQDMLRKQAGRFEYIDCFTRVLPDVFIVTEVQAQYPPPKGNRRLFSKTGRAFHPDKFGHELIMVLKEAGKLVAFTGCAHNGILNMVSAVSQQFPGLPIKGVFGGFHLMGLPKLNTMAASKAEVMGIGEELLGKSIERMYTGHCTGAKAYDVLKGVMADKLEYFPTGSQLVL